MSTLSEREEALRRALFNAAQSIEPAADGYERIRARLGTPRPTLVAWIEGAWSEVLRRSPAFIQDVAHKISSAIGFAWERFGPSSASGRQSGPLSWLRPAAALTVAIFVVAAGAYVGLSTSDLISNSAGVHAQGPGGSGHGNTGGGGSTQSKSGNVVGSITPGVSASPSSTSRCKGSKSIASVSPPTSPSPSGSSTSTSTGSSSPSPSSTTSSPSPSTTPSSATQGSQIPGTSGGDKPPTDGGAVTTAFQHYAGSKCGAGKKKSHKTNTTAKVTGTGPAGTVEIVFAARLIGRPAS